jgi:integrase
MDEGLQKATVNRYLSQLRHMIHWAIGRGYMSKSPFFNRLSNPVGVKLLKGENHRKRRLEDGEEQGLLEAADQVFQTNRADHEYVGRVMRARIEMALDFGLRRGERQKLTNRDVDWRAKPDVILTIRSRNAKSRKERRIAVVSPRVVRWLSSSAGRRGRRRSPLR